MRRRGLGLNRRAHHHGLAAEAKRSLLIGIVSALCGTLVVRNELLVAEGLQERPRVGLRLDLARGWE